MTAETVDRLRTSRRRYRILTILMLIVFMSTMFTSAIGGYTSLEIVLVAMHGAMFAVFAWTSQQCALALQIAQACHRVSDRWNQISCGLPHDRVTTVLGSPMTGNGTLSAELAMEWRYPEICPEVRGVCRLQDGVVVSYAAPSFPPVEKLLKRA